jgi:hypothetical protein
MMSTMAQMPGFAVKSSDGLFVDGEKSGEQPAPDGDAI